ncbi:alpha/beta hydrolase [Oceanisphaera avium]|uniref:Esterase n=1 Tax=Oceanisphaera avium TaxID=1903694 RepID=A0A1Y0CWD0_9GAMM|nr:alpha/beta hydrolase-fold protein [Oceanisphaera avium]ART79660.1 hypothetical protein CBP12_05410 [Oceanisphaera avium]
MKKIFIICCCLWVATEVVADSNVIKKSLIKPISSTQGGAEFYDFQSFSLSSIDQERHYRITVATPQAPAPKHGYPVLYMLDGNAVLPALTNEMFAALQGSDWPVIVTLSYEIDRQVARVYDYTPSPLNPSSAPDISQFTGRGRESMAEQRLATKSYGGANYGGAELFWQFIEHRIKPNVAKRVQIDKERQSLWGHSFGGLFVLHTLFNHPTSFKNYIAVDPSLWWQQGQILTAESAFIHREQRPVINLLVQSSASRREGSVLAEDSLRQLAKRLSTLPELNVQYHDYFSHHHGSVRSASIPAALRMAQTNIKLTE